MELQNFAVVVLRGMGLFLLLFAVIMGGALAVGRILTAFAAKPIESLDNQYFVVTETPVATFVIIATALCLLLGVAVIYFSTPLADLVVKGLQ